MSWIKKLLGRATSDTYLKREALYKSYRRLFFGPDGKMHEDGQRVLADLFDMAGIAQGEIKKLDGSISVEHYLIREGKREMVYGMIRRMNNPPRNQKEEENHEISQFIEHWEKELTV